MPSVQVNHCLAKILEMWESHVGFTSKTNPTFRMETASESKSSSEDFDITCSSYMKIGSGTQRANENDIDRLLELINVPSEGRFIGVGSFKFRFTNIHARLGQIGGHQANVIHQALEG